MRMKLKVFDSKMAICRLPSDAGVPVWATGEFCSITRTPDELSIVCEQERVPQTVEAERDWRMFRVEGKLDFSLTGILASIARPLAEAGVSIFSISTFNTDYIFVKSGDLVKAIAALKSAGFEVSLSHAGF